MLLSSDVSAAQCGIKFIITNYAKANRDYTLIARNFFIFSHYIATLLCILLT